MIISDDLRKAMSEKHSWSHSELENVEKFEGFFTHRETNEGLREYYIIIDLKCLKSSVISHECVHCANEIFFDIGQPGPAAGNDEAFAYLQGWLVKQFSKFIEESKLKSKYILS